MFDSKNNIYQRMAAITSELGFVAKNLNVEVTKGKGYKAVSEVDVLNAVRPLETKYGVYSYPVDREIIESAMLESENEYNGKVTKKTTFFEKIKTTYRFVNVDDPTDYIETITFAEGIDTQDKGSGKAMTYGDKYALMKAYKMRTGEDPDQNASEEVAYTPVDDAAQKKIYILSINKLLEDTATDGKQMLNFTNEKYGTAAQAFADLNMPQMIWVIRQLENKKEKMNKA